MWKRFKRYYANADMRVVAVVFFSALLYVGGRSFELIALGAHLSVSDMVLLPIGVVILAYFACIAVVRSKPL